MLLKPPTECAGASGPLDARYVASAKSPKFHRWERNVRQIVAAAFFGIRSPAQHRARGFHPPWQAPWHDCHSVWCICPCGARNKPFECQDDVKN